MSSLSQLTKNYLSALKITECLQILLIVLIALELDIFHFLANVCDFRLDF